MMRKNKNREYQKLRVWNDALDFYVETTKIFRKFPYELKRVAGQAISYSDSVHRNIAEGYCRRSINGQRNNFHLWKLKSNTPALPYSSAPKG